MPRHSSNTTHDVTFGVLFEGTLVGIKGTSLVTEMPPCPWRGHRHQPTSFLQPILMGVFLNLHLIQHITHVWPRPRLSPSAIQGGRTFLLIECHGCLPRRCFCRALSAPPHPGIPEASPLARWDPQHPNKQQTIRKSAKTNGGAFLLGTLLWLVSKINQKDLNQQRHTHIRKQANFSKPTTKPAALCLRLRHRAKGHALGQDVGDGIGRRGEEVVLQVLQGLKASEKGKNKKGGRGVRNKRFHSSFRSSSGEVRIRVPDLFRLSILVGEPSPKKGKGH